MGPWLTLISTSEAILLCVYQPSILSVLLTFPSVARAQAAAVPTGRLLHAKGASHFKRKYRRPNHGARRGAGRRASPLRAHLRLASPPQQIIANYPPPLLQNCHEHWSEKARVLLRCTRVPRNGLTISQSMPAASKCGGDLGAPTTSLFQQNSWSQASP